MKQTRRDFLRGMIGWGGLLLAGSLRLAAVRSTEPIRKAQRFFAARQSADGAWRSGCYAAFREGDVLTPVVLWAMQPGLANEDVVTRGLQWLREWTDGLGRRENPWTALRYPLFTASYAAQVLARCGDLGRAAVWVKIIDDLRTSERLGWLGGDPMCGAWSDASSPPRYVAPVPDMLAPNVSATALALNALAAAGCSERGGSARPFIEQCQNFAQDRPNEFDDGGFFFALDDPIRNKAGIAGHDTAGRTRFRSYGSATCDGLLALRACGFPPGHPRVRAAVEWVRLHCEGLTHGGDWPGSRAEARDSLAFYQSQALAAVLAEFQPHSGWSQKLRESVTSVLLAAQDDAGGWQGLAPDSCEDEPLLASAFAVRALSLLA